MHLHTWEWSRWELIGVNFTSFFDIVGCLSPNKTGIKSAAGPLCTPLLNWIKASFILWYVTCIRNPNLQQSHQAIIIQKSSVLKITKVNPYIDHELISFIRLHNLYLQANRYRACSLYLPFQQQSLACFGEKLCHCFHHHNHKSTTRTSFDFFYKSLQKRWFYNHKTEKAYRGQIKYNTNFTYYMVHKIQD